MAENSDIQILEVAGRKYADEEYLHQTIFGMELNSELTKSRKGFYHAEINPNLDESHTMTFEQWMQAADILEKELGFENQPRVVVMHEKKGRKHIHVVWDRYDQQKGIMKTINFNYYDHDRARREMEQVFNHAPTPRWNKNRPEVKKSLKDIWDKSPSGAAFIKECFDKGYLISRGTMKDPYMVVDKNGRSFTLRRQLGKEVKLKDVRQRLRNEELLSQNDAIKKMRDLQSDGNSDKGAAQKAEQEKPHMKAARAKAVQFAQSRNDVLKSETKTTEQDKEKQVQDFVETRDDAFTPSKPDLTFEQRKAKIADEFAQSRDTAFPDENRDKSQEDLLQEHKLIRERNRRRARRRSR